MRLKYAKHRTTLPAILQGPLTEGAALRRATAKYQARRQQKGHNFFHKKIASKKFSYFLRRFLYIFVPIFISLSSHTLQKSALPVRPPLLSAPVCRTACTFENPTYARQAYETAIFLHIPHSCNGECAPQVQ